MWKGQPVCGSCLAKLEKNAEPKKPGETAGIVPPPENLGFNFGAFFLTPLWLLFHGKAAIGVLLIILNIFLRGLSSTGTGGLIVSVIVSFAIMIYFGSRGNKIAWKHKGYSSTEDMKNNQRPWMIGGIIVWIAAAGLLVLFYSAM